MIFKSFHTILQGKKKKMPHPPAAAPFPRIRLIPKTHGATWLRIFGIFIVQLFCFTSNGERFPKHRVPCHCEPAGTQHPHPPGAQTPTYCSDRARNGQWEQFLPAFKYAVEIKLNHARFHISK